MNGSGKFDPIEERHCVKDERLGYGAVRLYGAAGTVSAAKANGRCDNARGRNKLTLAVFRAARTAIAADGIIVFIIYGEMTAARTDYADKFFHKDAPPVIIRHRAP